MIDQPVKGLHLSRKVALSIPPQFYKIIGFVMPHRKASLSPKRRFDQIAGFVTR